MSQVCKCDFSNETYEAATGRALQGFARSRVASNMSRRSEAHPRQVVGLGQGSSLGESPRIASRSGTGIAVRRTASGMRRGQTGRFLSK